TTAIPSRLGCSLTSRSRQLTNRCGWVATRPSATTTTTRFRARYTPTSTTAIPMASLNPLRNSAPSSPTSTSVTRTCWPCSARGQRRDARLVPEGGEVVHAGQAHHLPPRALVGDVRSGVRPLHLPGVRLGRIFEQPFAQPAAPGCRLGLQHPGHSRTLTTADP